MPRVIRKTVKLRTVYVIPATAGPTAESDRSLSFCPATAEMADQPWSSSAIHSGDRRNGCRDILSYFLISF